MKICQIVPCFPYQEHIEGLAIGKKYHVGGVEKHALILSQHLQNNGDEVTVITTKSPEHNKLTELKLGFKIIRVPLGMLLYSSSMPFSVFRRFNPSTYDIIHAHTPTPALADLAAIRNIQKKCPFILTYHNDITKDSFVGKITSAVYNNTLGEYLLRHTDVIIATSQSYAKTSENLKNHIAKIKIVPNAVDNQIFRRDIDAGIIRHKHAIPNESKVILFVGRIDSYKGCDYLVRAFALLSAKLPDSYLLFVGTGPLKNSLKTLAKDLGLLSRIKFAGYVSDKELPNIFLKTCWIKTFLIVFNHNS